ncbi:MAG: hypothetical protein U5M23_08690 [Marinagarivorans sp.]|nr:hypothetical protein [Marinagarivorans sp.]
MTSSTWEHSWFSVPDDDAVSDVRLKGGLSGTDYCVPHHNLKNHRYLLACADFLPSNSALLPRRDDLAIDDLANRWAGCLQSDALITDYSASAFEYQAPDEWRLDRQLADYARPARHPWQDEAG